MDDNSIEAIHREVEQARSTMKGISITELGSITYQGGFFNMVCQIVSVLVPSRSSFPLTILRVCDGSCYNYKGPKPMYRLNDSEITDGSVRDMEMETMVCTVDIACFDEYAGKAKDFESGDVVRISNVRAVDKTSMMAINLHGDGEQGKRFNRGFAFIKKAECRPNEKERSIQLDVEVVPAGKDKQLPFEAKIVDDRIQYFEEESDPGDNSFDEAVDDASRK